MKRQSSHDLLPPLKKARIPFTLMVASISLEFRSPDCTHWRHALHALVDGELASLCAARAEAHVAGCAPCAHRLAAAREYKRVLRRVGESERAPSELRGAVMASLRGVWGSRTH